MGICPDGFYSVLCPKCGTNICNEDNRDELCDICTHEFEIVKLCANVGEVLFPNTPAGLQDLATAIQEHSTVTSLYIEVERDEKSINEWER